MHKVGEIVRVMDGSYSLEIADFTLKHVYGVDLQNEGKWSIIAINCDLPADNIFNSNQRNNTIIKSLTHNRIVFIQERSLYSVHQCNKCPHCGAQLKEK